jgi:NADH-quinone oxidoreductase subunit C
MALENTVIQDKLTEFGENVFTLSKRKIFSFEVAADKITAIILFKKMTFTCVLILTDLCGIHYPDNEVDRQFTIVYHMHNWYENKR